MAIKALKQTEAHTIVLIAPWVLDVIDTITNGYEVEEVMEEINDWYDRFMKCAYEEDKTVIIFHQIIDKSDPEKASNPTYRLNLRRNNDHLKEINDCLTAIEGIVKWKCSHKFAASY